MFGYQQNNLLLKGYYQKFIELHAFYLQGEMY